MRTEKLALAAVALVSFTGFAGAQSAFGGFYVGATAGYDFGSTKVSESVTDDSARYFPPSSLSAISAAGAHSANPGGFTGGITAGYNLSAKNWLLGFEVDYSVLSLSASHSSTGIYPCCSADFTLDQSVKATSLETARLRFGYVIPKWLFYGTAGLAFGTVKYSQTFTDDLANASESASQSSAQTGWSAGAGAEHLLAPDSKWSLKLEYLYASLGTMTGTSANMSADVGDATVLFPKVVFTHSTTVTMSLLRLGINYHFK